jgi:deazaflavin-dependent oxidoreductase (nitroreductase family)
MTESQRPEAFAEPSRSDIPALTREHVRAMKASAEAPEWNGAGMPHLVLRTVGRRSGRELEVALPYWFDRDGTRIVVASFAGAPNHPAWYLNLADRAANPRVFVRVQRASFWADARTLEGEERERVWRALVADRPFYADYQSRTARTLPVVRLVEAAGA